MGTAERRPHRAELDAIVDALTIEEIRVLVRIAASLHEASRTPGAMDVVIRNALTEVRRST